jgi:hypothetical protein
VVAPLFKSGGVVSLGRYTEAGGEFLKVMSVTAALAVANSIPDVRVEVMDAEPRFGCDSLHVQVQWREISDDFQTGRRRAPTEAAKGE